jgi:hypothetical protein
MARYTTFDVVLKEFENELLRKKKIYGFDYDIIKAGDENFAKLLMFYNKRMREYRIEFKRIGYYTDIIAAINAILDNFYDADTNRSILPRIEKVIYNGPATIVKWADGTKTVVKCCEDDVFDPEKGLAMAISKKALGDLKEVKEWAKTYEEPKLVFDFKIPTPSYSIKDLAETFRNIMRRRGEVNDV